jgi:hypothetical protein
VKEDNELIEQELAIQLNSLKLKLMIVQNCENIDHNKKLNNLNKFDDIDENDNKDKNNQSP